MASEPVFTPVGRAPRLADVLAERMLDAILSGQFQVGEILPSERALCSQFGVSRTVVREAIRSLSTRGVVKVQSGRGVEVMPRDNAPMAEAMSILVRGSPAIDFEQVHEIRTMLETHVAAVAARRSRPGDAARLHAIVDEMASASGDLDLKSQLDVAFHRELARLARNELYTVLLDSVGGVLLSSRRRTLRLTHDERAWVEEHRAIAVAVEARDEAGARAAMETHLANVNSAWSSAAREPDGTDDV